MEIRLHTLGRQDYGGTYTAGGVRVLAGYGDRYRGSIRASKGMMDNSVKEVTYTWTAGVWMNMQLGA